MRKLSFFLFLTALAGCNSPGGGGTGPGGGNRFKITGIFARDANLTFTRDKASFQLTRNDTTFKLAALTIDTFKVDTTASSNYFRQSPPDFLRPGQNHSVSLVHAPSVLNFITSLLMPDTFSFIITNPANHINTGAQAVSIDWTGSANAGGYLVVCRNDSALLDTSFFSSTGTTSATIPQEAFRSGLNPVSGLYKIYVVSFRGGLFPYSGMPFSLPAGYASSDTTYSQTVTGRIGAAFVSRLDTVRVP